MQREIDVEHTVIRFGLILAPYLTFALTHYHPLTHVLTLMARLTTTVAGTVGESSVGPGVTK